MTSRPRGLLRAAATIACLAVSAWAAPALSASLVCRQLEARLAATPQQGGNAQIRRFDRALNVQRRELGKARDEAQRARCGFAVFNRNVEICASLNAAIARMEDNLATLGRQREAMVRGVDPGLERARLLASINTNECREKPSAPTAPRTIDARTGLETNGQADNQPKPVLDPPSEVTSSTNHVVIRGSMPDPGASYRTMCVRACDGYYFPMSYGVSESHFTADESACHQRCPGVDVNLYYQDVDGDDPDVMTSVRSGESYSQLSNAYLYRTANRPSAATCGCNAGSGLSVASHDSSSKDQDDGASGSFIVLGSPDSSFRNEPVRKDISIPQLRIGPAKSNGIPGETISKKSVEADTAGASPLSARPQVEPDRDRNVRVVGPKFLPDPSAAIDLRAPVPPHDR